MADIRSNERSAVSLVDAGRLIAILIVIAIHTDAFGSYPRADYVFSNFIKIYAVPFFFVCSGFFLGVKLKRTNTLAGYREALGKYGRRLLTPYLFWGVINFLVEIVVNVSKGMQAKQALVEQLHSWLVTSPGRALWYVQAILILLLVLWVSNERKYLVGVTVAGAVLTFVLPCLEAAAALNNQAAADALAAYKRVFITEHNFVFYGVFVTGAILAAIDGLFDADRKGVCLLLMAVAVVVTILARNTAFFAIAKRVSMLLFSFAAFGLLLQSRAPYSQAVSLRFRALSTMFYFTHIPVKYMFQLLFQKLRIDNSLLVYCATLAALLVYSGCVMALKKRSAAANRLFSAVY